MDRIIQLMEPTKVITIFKGKKVVKVLTKKHDPSDWNYYRPMVDIVKTVTPNGTLIKNNKSCTIKQ